MDSDTIAGRVVGEALRAVRHGRPIGGSPLLQLHAVRTRLQRSGRDSGSDARSVALGLYLDELVWEQLERLRGSRAKVRRRDLTPRLEMELLTQDLRVGSTELEAWSLLYWRYFSLSHIPLATTAAQLSISRRTLRRRITAGHELLADILKEREASAPPPPPHNLPLQLTSFVGREQELADLSVLLLEHRLVTLTGPGGMGKSRLALETGRRLLGDYPDGVWLIELAALEDGTLVAEAFAAALELKEEPRREAADVLASHLQNRRLLLVVDNCEHLLDSCAALVESLLVSCRDLKVLATSREMLGIAGEQKWPVPALSLPEVGAATAADLCASDAVQLFAERARLRQPDFEIDDDTAPPVARVCRQLDGIALSIELAAAHIDLLEPEELAAQVQDCFELTRSRLRAPLERHRSLHAAIDWSYGLLTDAERRLFRRLSPLVGWFDLAAARAVHGTEAEEPPDTAELLTKLHDKSMVVAESVPRLGKHFQLLEPLRQYGALRLAEAGESHDVKLRHATHYALLAEESETALKGPEQQRWIDLLTKQRDNVRAALSWTVDSGEIDLGLRMGGAIWRFWYLIGAFHEGHSLLSRLVVAGDGGGRSANRAKVLHAAGTLATYEGRLSEARELLEEGLRIERESGDLLAVAGTLNNLGLVAFELADYETARGLFAESLEIKRELGDQHGEAVSMSNLALVALEQCDYEAARAHATESLAIKRELGDQRAVAESLNALGEVANNCSDSERAAAYFSECLQIHRALGNSPGVAQALRNLGNAAHVQGDLAEARSLYLRSIDIDRQAGARLGLQQTLCLMCHLSLDDGDLQAARRYADEAADLTLGEYQRNELAVLLACQGRTELEAGKLASARGLLAESLEIFGQLGTPLNRIDVLECLLVLSWQEGHPGAALTLEAAASAHRQRIGATRTPIGAHRLVPCLADAREALTRDAAAAAAAAGRKMTLDEACAFALAETP